MIAPLEPAGGSPVRKPKPSCKPSAAPPADSVPTEQIEKLKERFLAALKELSHQGKIFCDHCGTSVVLRLVQLGSRVSTTNTGSVPIAAVNPAWS